jgi:hypothetical protein
MPVMTVSSSIGRLGAVLQRPFHSGFGIGDAERHRAGRGAMLVAELRDAAVGVAVEHQVDATLLVAGDVLAEVPVRGHEAELLELTRHRLGIGRSEFDELEAVEAQRIMERICGIGHGAEIDFRPDSVN